LEIGREVCGMQRYISLSEVAPGQSCTVRRLCMSGSMRRRLMDIGMIENTVVTCVGRSPGGDPSAYLIRGAVIAIRAKDGRDVLVSAYRGADRVVEPV